MPDIASHASCPSCLNGGALRHFLLFLDFPDRSFFGQAKGAESRYFGCVGISLLLPFAKKSLLALECSGEFFVRPLAGPFSSFSVRFQHTAPIIFRRLDKALFRCWLRPHFEHHQGTIPNLEWRLVASIGDHTGFSYCRVIGPRPQFCGPTTDVTGIYAEAAHHSRASRFGWRPNHHRSSITPQRPHGSAGGG